MRSFANISLKNRMVILLGIVGALQTSAIGLFAWFNLTDSLSDQIGLRALKVAQTVAAMPGVLFAVKHEDIDFLNEIASDLAKTNQARFIVIGNKDGIRLAHPNPAKIGLSMADDDGDDNAPALVQGEGYISKAKGSLGLTMRGKAPIFDRDGKTIVGVVSVGYLLDQVQETIGTYSVVLGAFIIAMILISIVIAMIIAARFKREIFGLEPEQISQLFEEQNATLQTIREGVIAINRKGIVTTCNKNAIESLKLKADQDVVGQHITNLLPESGLLHVLETGQPEFDNEIWLQGKAMIVNRIPMKLESEIIGVVSSFRPKNELDLVSKKLTRIETLTDSLRSQAHEYSNKLHTIAGLIQLGANDEALTVIGHETEVHQAFIQQLMNDIQDPLVAGCLLGKYSRAREMGLSLRVDNDSQIQVLPEQLPAEQLVSCFGNLIDNALEATLKHTGAGGKVTLSMTDIGNDIIFEVEDQGGGVPINQQERLFEKGFTSKNSDNHGYGLHLVKQFVNQWGGDITIETAAHSARFILYIPKITNRKKQQE